MSEPTDTDLLDWLNEYAQQRLAATQAELTRQWNKKIDNCYQLNPCIRRAIRNVMNEELTP